ncbi:hypothetical protein JTB14_030076 [Gonioctena quinquepunctata]|nr:hypothetical protein JTB14_030076 [Gonioctena quinquepunctata]
MDYHRSKMSILVPPFLFKPRSEFENFNHFESISVSEKRAMAEQQLISECLKFQKILYHPLKKTDFLPENGSEVFVKHIPIDATDVELAEFFGQAGNIFQLRLMMAENGVENRGFCYVSYMNSVAARKAIAELAFRMFRKDVFLNVENSLNNCRIFIGGIPTFKSKDQVWQELGRNGVKNIVDVIMYRSYSNRAENRGFVFVEFKTHEIAAHFRAKYANSLRLWGTSVIVDWSVPVPETEPFILDSVKILYMRNLSITDSTEDLHKSLLRFIKEQDLEKVYKFKNYAFVHVSTRRKAEELMKTLKDHYRDTIIEIEWAKPSNKFTTIEYRQQKFNELSRINRPRTHSSSSNFSQRSNMSDSSRDEHLEIDQKTKGITPSVDSPDVQRVADSYRDVVRGTCRPSCNQYAPQPCYWCPPQTSPNLYTRPPWAQAFCRPPVYALQRFDQNRFPNYSSNFTQLPQRNPTPSLSSPATSSEYDPISDYQRRMTELYGMVAEEGVAETTEQCDFCDLLRRLNL